MRGKLDDRAPATERAHFEALVDAKASLYWADRTPAGQRRRDIRAELLMALITAGPGNRILEIGCGTGEYTCTFPRFTSATLVSVDIAPGVVSRARARVDAGVHVAAADVEALPFASESFDAVTGNAVLHHLRLDRALPELLRVLRPGGSFCFAEPNFLNPHVFLERTVPWIARRLDDSPGETAFIRWQLCRELARFNLVDVSVRPFDFLYPLVPRRLIGPVERLGRLLERTPLVREIAGSLLVSARKAGENAEARRGPHF